MRETNCQHSIPQSVPPFTMLFQAEQAFYKASSASPANPTAAPSRPTQAAFVGAAPVPVEEEAAACAAPVAELVLAEPVGWVALFPATPELVAPAPPALHGFVGSVAGVNVWELTARA